MRTRGFVVSLSLALVCIYSTGGGGILIGQSAGTSSAGRTVDTAVISCTVEALAPRAPSGTAIVSVTHVAAADGVPAYCRVDAQVATPGNTLNVRLRLPAAWNGKFFFHGVGGLAGSVEP